MVIRECLIILNLSLVVGKMRLGPFGLYDDGKFDNPLVISSRRTSSFFTITTVTDATYVSSTPSSSSTSSTSSFTTINVSDDSMSSTVISPYPVSEHSYSEPRAGWQFLKEYFLPIFNLIWFGCGIVYYLFKIVNRILFCRESMNARGSGVPNMNEIEMESYGGLAC